MAQVSGITIERTNSGKAVFARIDLRKHSDIIPILENKGAEVKKPINWSATMKKSFAQAKNGEYHKVDMDDFWNI